jgi:hypothetical protein
MAKTNLTLAEALALLVRRRPASKEAWQRLQRRDGGRFPEPIQRGIDEAGQAILEMIRRRDVEAWGRFCDRDKGTGSSAMAAISDGGFLAEPLWVDPCADVIWTEFDLGDGRFNPVDRGYRDVVLNRAQFLEALKAQLDLSLPEGMPHAPKDDAFEDVDEVAARSSVLQQRAPRRFSEIKLESWYRDLWIKRNQQEGRIPTRADDLRAARSDVSPHVPRDVVRR